MPRAGLTVLVVAACIAIGGGALLVLGSGEDAPEGNPETEPTRPTTFNVFLRNPTTNHDELAEPFGALPGVTEVEYVSKDEAVSVLQEKLENDDLAESLGRLNSNPLPASYRVTFDQAIDGSEAKALLVAAAGSNRSLIDEVIYAAPPDD